jgi:hypothetical protein
MSVNYYDILGLSATATTAEIDSAYEAQCTQLERLVNHPDAQTASKAQYGLQFLQQAYETLSDPEKRRAYDASIDVIAGVADPEAIPDSTPPATPPAPVEVPEAPAPDVPVDAWQCPACQALNPIGSRFCRACGETLAQACPQCDALVEIAAAFCSVCGFDLQAYTPPLALQTELKPADAKLAAKIEKQLEKTILQQWRGANLITEEVSAALERGLVISLGMVKKSFHARFSLSLQCEQSVQVQISSDSGWLTVSPSSLTLDAQQRQTLSVTVDAGRLEGGQFYAGTLTITTSDATPTVIKHYIMLGTKKFFGAGDAKDKLKSQVPIRLETVSLAPAFIDSMVRVARQATFDGAPAKSAAAYARAIRFMANPHIDPDIVISPYEKSTPRIAALAQRWHQFVRPQLADELEPPGIGWLNWNPQMSLGKHVPFHLTGLWQITTTPTPKVQVTPDSQERILYRLTEDWAIDPLTGEAIKMSHSMPPLPTVGLGKSIHSARNMASDGDFVVQIDGRRLVAKQDKRVCWDTKVGGLFGANGTVIMGKRHVYYYNGQNILAFDRDTGQQTWQQAFDAGITYNPPQFVEVNGYLLAMYVSLERAGFGASTRYDHQQNFVWWDQSGRKQKTQFSIGRGKDQLEVDPFNACYAVAPTIPEAFSKHPNLQNVFARVVIAYRRTLYEVLLFNQKTSLEFLPPWGAGGYSNGDKGMHKKWEYDVLPVEEQHLYLHMFGPHTCLIFSQGKIGPIQGTLHLASVDTLFFSRDRARTISFSGLFSKEHFATFRNSNSEHKRKMLFDMTTAGGVLILRSHLEKSRGAVYAYV